MKVKTLTLAVGPPGSLSFQPDEIIDVKPDVAKQLIQAGAAVDLSKAKKEVKPKPDDDPGADGGRLTVET